MSNTIGAHDPSALVRRGHLPFAESAKGRNFESYAANIRSRLRSRRIGITHLPKRSASSSCR